MTPTLPDNISLTIGIDTNHNAIAEALSGENNSLAENLGLLGRFYKIKIWFTEPVTVFYQGKWRITIEGNRTIRTKSTRKKVTEYIFNGFFYQHGQLYYMLKSNSRKGYPVEFLNKIIKWELVLTDKGAKTFKNYDAFLRRFDLRFITETEVKNLWNSKSAQTGKHYRPSDFRSIGKQGKRVMQRFSEHFNHMDDIDSKVYTKGEFGTHLTEYYYSSHHKGRDISINHNILCPYVHYSSEYHGCGNGDYGLIVNESTYLYLEKD